MFFEIEQFNKLKQLMDMKANKSIIISKVFILMICLVLSTGNSFAQEIRVRNISQLTTDLSARSVARLDDNNKECAIVRVNIPSIKTIKFENIVGEVEYNAGEYILYVSEGTNQIPFFVEGFNDSNGGPAGFR